MLGTLDQAPTPGAVGDPRVKPVDDEKMSAGAMSPQSKPAGDDAAQDFPRAAA